MRVLSSMIGLIAPPTCISCGVEGQSLCSLCSNSEILPYGEKCWHCGAVSKNAKACDIARRNGSPRSVWVVSDYDGVAKKLVQAYKFGQQRSLATPIAETMVQTLLEFNSDRVLGAQNYLLVPLPTASSRVRRRGFDHTGLLTQGISYKLKLQLAKNLQRLGQSRQVGAKRDERLHQLEQSFYVKNKEVLKGRNVLLIDDVTTTGATINAASKTLKAAGVKNVDALVFAKKL